MAKKVGFYSIFIVLIMTQNFHQSSLCDVVFFVFHLVQLYIFTLWMPWSMFRWNISLSTNLLFLKSGVCVCTSLLTMLLASNQFPTQLYFTLPQIHSSSIIIRPLGLLFHLENLNFWLKESSEFWCKQTHFDGRWLTNNGLDHAQISNVNSSKF